MKTFCTYFAISLSTVLFTLAIFEVCLRYFRPQPIIPSHFVDSGIGVRENEPNVEARFIRPGSFDVIASTNSEGIRGKQNYRRSKPPGVMRTCLLGDSMAFGYGVSDKSVMSHVLEQILNNRQNNIKYEVLNFGVISTGQAEQLKLYHGKVERFDCDYLLMVYYSNDITNNIMSNLFELDERRVLQPKNQQYLPKIKLNQFLYSLYPTRWIFTHSHTWSMIRNSASTFVWKVRDGKRKLASHLKSINNEAVELTIGLFREFEKVGIRDGFKLGVLVVPDRSGKTNFPVSENDFSLPATKIINGERHFKRNDYFENDIHLNAFGHKRAAELMATLIDS